MDRWFSELVVLWYSSFQDLILPQETFANVFEALIWTLTTLAIGLSIGRYLIRYKTVRGLDVADVFHGVALFLLLLLTISSTIESSAPGKSLFETDLKTYLQIKTAMSCLWLISLYGIKFSFLFFYRSIFGISQLFMRAWWLVTAFTLIAFWVSLGGVIAQGGRTAQNILNASE